MESRDPYRLPAVVVCLAASAAIGMAVAGLAMRVPAMWPLDVHLRDDAYYYFSWARSLASGQGPCVTEAVVTSGVHLAWALLLSLLSLLSLGSELPAASVGLGLVMHLLTGLVIYRCAAPVRWLGLSVAGIYVGSHFLTYEAMNGQETAFGCLSLALLLAIRPCRTRWFFLLGLLAVAARSDLIFLVAAAALVRREGGARRLIATVAILVCYAAWNYLLADHWLQDSAVPIPWLMADEFAHAGTPRLERWAPHLWSLAQLVPLRQASTPLLLAWLLMIGVGWRRREPGFAWLFGAGLTLVVFHSLWREYPRDYYFAPLGVIGALALVRLTQLHPRLGVCIAGLGIAWNAWHLLDEPVVRGWQREMTMAGRFADRVLPAGESLGCFNSGIVGWEQAGREHPVLVVNLDGVVNRPAFVALRQHRLSAYLAANDVHYLIDNPIQFQATGVHANGRHFGAGFRVADDLEEVARFVWPTDPRRSQRRTGTGSFRLYRLAGGGAPPVRPTRTLDLGPAPPVGKVARARFVLWPGRRGQRLRTDTRELLVAEAVAVYILQVPWDGGGELRLFVGESKTPVLSVATE